MEYPLEVVFSKDSPYQGSTSALRRKAVKYGLLKYECAVCGNKGEWQQKKLSLQLDHINGDCCDHRIENLQILCPNCHTQTETYAGKNSRNSRPTGRTKRSKAKFWEDRVRDYEKRQQLLIPLIETSSIDFSSYGWVGKVARLTNLRPQKVTRWMRRFMPQFYQDRCFKRSNLVMDSCPRKLKNFLK